MATETAAWLGAMRTRHGAGPAVFVESGTYQGTTARLAAEQFRIVHTVELSEALYAEHSPGLEAAHINCYLGDSRRVIPSLAAQIEEPVFWYLDAHWWQGEPERQLAWTPLPLWDELAAIAARPLAADIVVVDDVACFGTRYPIPQGEEMSVDRISAYFPGAREIVVLGDQLVIYR